MFKVKFMRLAIGLVTWVSSLFIASAGELAMNDNPYTPIVTRNIFGLVPIPTNPPVDTASLASLPKITPNGIMTLFGKKQALYKVAVPGKPGKPAQDQSYVMTEGEGEDGIEVVKIDDKADVITFNNHDTIQDLPLAEASNVSSASVPTPTGSPGAPGVGANRFPRP